MKNISEEIEGVYFVGIGGIGMCISSRSPNADRCALTILFNVPAPRLPPVTKTVFFFGSLMIKDAEAVERFMPVLSGLLEEEGACRPPNHRLS